MSGDDDQPSDKPSAVNRPLTDDERRLLRQLAIWNVAEQNGVDAREAADALDDLIAREGMVLQCDACEANLRVRDEDGPVIIHATREWLDYWAHMEIPLTRAHLLESRGRRPPPRNVN